MKFDWRLPYAALSAIAAQPFVASVVAHAQVNFTSNYGNTDPIVAGQNISQIAFLLIAGGTVIGIAGHGVYSILSGHRGRGIAELMTDAGLVATAKVLYTRIGG